MTDAVIRRYLTILRREWWVILQAAVVVGLVAGLLATPRPDVDVHRRRAALRRAPGRSRRHVAARGPADVLQPQHLDLVRARRVARGEASSADVLEGAAASVGDGAGFSGVQPSVNAESRTITISASADTPRQAVKFANAVAQSLVDVRWSEREAALEAQITAIGKQLVDIQSQISQVNAQAAAATTGGADTSSFDTARAVYLTQYQTIFSNLQQLQSALVAKDNGVQFLLPAQGAGSSTASDPLQRGLEGAAIGLVLGIGLAALREVMDSKVRDRERVETLTGIPAIAEVPKEPGLRKRPLAVFDAPHAPYSEAIRALRATLMWADGDAAPGSIAVTGAQSGDGATMVAANLAAAFALAGVNTILVSADFTDPMPELGLFERGGTPRVAAGLADLLTSRDPVERSEAMISQLLVATRVPQLRWLPATSSPNGAGSGAASERLSSSRARKLFVALAGEAELVVVDSPPALLSDGASITGMVDGVVLVVRLGTTRRARLARIARQWRGAPINPRGVVLNGTNRRGGPEGIPAARKAPPRRRTPRALNAGTAAISAPPPFPERRG